MKVPKVFKVFNFRSISLKIFEHLKDHLILGLGVIIWLGRGVVRVGKVCGGGMGRG